MHTVIPVEVYDYIQKCVKDRSPVYSGKALAVREKLFAQAKDNLSLETDKNEPLFDILTPYAADGRMTMKEIRHAIDITLNKKMKANTAAEIEMA